MRVLNVLNLYAGLGGNRKNWKDVEVTAVESDPKIAAVYEKLYPDLGNQILECYREST